ncbi:PsiF family protein [Acidovorax lacteus]|uniref:PsiF family protein n=1 Tax=Acidovorax lacteus TaxID=1924988 RepID=A0ABP8L332_9BURK
MKAILSVAALSLCLASGAAWAETAQQSLMATCNAEAAGKKGDERKQFMSECLSDKKKRQQARMKTCNAEAAGKKGDERKQFMSECLKAS